MPSWRPPTKCALTAPPAVFVGLGPRGHPRDRPARGRRRRPRRSGLGGVQGRCPFLWRRVRHHPPDAARRRRHLPLDDRRSSSTPSPWARSPPVRWSKPWPVVGYAAARIGGGFLAELIAFAPSFAFVLLGGSRFDQIRGNSAVESFLTGAGPAVTGAIAGSAIPLGLAFAHLWQIPVLAGALLWLFVLRRGVVIGATLALAGLPA
jgi:Chromate transporter